MRPSVTPRLTRRGARTPRIQPTIQAGLKPWGDGPVDRHEGRRSGAGRVSRPDSGATVSWSAIRRELATGRAGGAPHPRLGGGWGVRRGLRQSLRGQRVHGGQQGLGTMRPQGKFKRGTHPSHSSTTGLSRCPPWCRGGVARPFAQGVSLARSDWGGREVTVNGESRGTQGVDGMSVLSETRVEEVGASVSNPLKTKEYYTLPQHANHTS